MTLIPDNYDPPEEGGLIRDQDKPQDLDDLEREVDDERDDEDAVRDEPEDERAGD